MSGMTRKRNPRPPIGIYALLFSVSAALLARLFEFESLSFTIFSLVFQASSIVPEFVDTPEIAGSEIVQPLVQSHRLCRFPVSFA
jgi:hypothetical protein